MKQSEVKHCALYLRVSTTDQGERYSLPSQLKALREKAAREGYTVREDHLFVDKHTGKVATRPAFDRMNALVKSGAVPPSSSSPWTVSPAEPRMHCGWHASTNTTT
jgi:hypothetical protein